MNIRTAPAPQAEIGVGAGLASGTGMTPARRRTWAAGAFGFVTGLLLVAIWPDVLRYYRINGL